MASPAANSGRRKRRPPATTVEGREIQLVALAVDVAEEQMRNGKVSAQVLTHYLKLGTERERLEREKLRKENTLLDAKANALASAERMERLYDEALKAMRTYQGHPDEAAYEAEELQGAFQDPRLRRAV